MQEVAEWRRLFVRTGPARDRYGILHMALEKDTSREMIANELLLWGSNPD